MLPKNAVLKQFPRGGLPRRPLSLPGMNAGVSRGDPDEHDTGLRAV